MILFFIDWKSTTTTPSFHDNLYQEPDVSSLTSGCQVTVKPDSWLSLSLKLRCRALIKIHWQIKITHRI